jgi:hypothetical protein
MVSGLRRLTEVMTVPTIPNVSVSGKAQSSHRKWVQFCMARCGIGDWFAIDGYCGLACP